MNNRRRSALVGAVVLALLAAAAGGRPVRGQADPGPAVGPADLAVFGRGTQAFRRILFDRGFRPAQGNDPPAAPSRTLVVVLGETGVVAEVRQANGGAGGLRRFVEAGGALLVATDRPSHEAVSEEFGVGVKGELLYLEDGGSGYLGLRECPQVLATSRGQPPLFRPPALPEGRGQPAAPRVATNMPSRLDLGRDLAPGLSVLALLPPRCRTASQRLAGLTPAFAVGGQVGAGAVLVMADHSVFINDMVLRPDNGNLDFAYRVAEWLKQGPEPRDGPRDRIIYFEDGVERRDFDIPLKDVPLPELPPPEALVPLINGTLHGLEKENAFNRLLLHFVPREDLWRVLLLVGAGALALYGFVRLGMFTYRPDRTVPALASLVSRESPSGPLSGPLMEHRLREQMRLGHFGEAAHTLAAELFAGVGVSPGGSAEGRRRAAPGVAVAGRWWQQWVWRRRVRRLWELARGVPRGPVSRRGLAAVARNVRRLEAALADGTVALTE